MDGNLDVMKMPGQESGMQSQPNLVISDTNDGVLTIERMRLWNSAQETGCKPKQRDVEEVGAR